MKTIFRSMSLGLAAAVFVAAGAASALAQDSTTPSQCADVETFNTLYGKFTPTIGSEKRGGKDVAVFLPKTLEEKQAALANAKEILEKYGACPKPASPTAGVDFTANVAYVKAWVPVIEANIKSFELGKIFTRYDNGIKSENYDEAFAAGREILAKQPDNLNILVPLGVVGLYQSYKNNFKYNDESVRYAQQALALIKSGKELPKKNETTTKIPTAGVFQYEYTKDDAISELTYALGYINFYAKKDQKAALPYYYEVSQLPGRYRTEPRVYATIGSAYAEAGAKVGQELADLIAKQKAAKTEAEKAAFEPEIQAKLGLFNGYTERIIDAYARAYTNAKASKTPDKAYTDSLYKILQDTYRRRFDKIEGLDAYVAATVAKPLPNPTSTVTPVLDPEPVKATGAATTVTAPAATTPVAATAPATKVTTTTTTTTSSTTTAVKPAVTAKTPVKKVVVRRKGTR